MSVKNWAGQTIDVGSIVWRGARAGNTSDFKIGRILDVNPDKRTARVEWLYTEGRSWLIEKYLPRHAWENVDRIARMKSKGSPSIDSLAVLDIDVAELEQRAKIFEDLHNEATRVRDLTRT